jgi:hypothetical protein
MRANFRFVDRRFVLLTAARPGWLALPCNSDPRACHKFIVISDLLVRDATWSTATEQTLMDSNILRTAHPPSPDGRAILLMAAAVLTKGI